MDGVVRAARLQVSGVSKSFRRKPALVDLQLHLDPGEVVGLIGPNGAGKTTTLRILTGRLREDRGEVRWGQQRLSPSARAATVALVPDQPGAIPQLSVWDHLEFVALPPPWPQLAGASALVDQFELEEQRDQLGLVELVTLLPDFLYQLGGRGPGEGDDSSSNGGLKTGERLGKPQDGGTLARAEARENPAMPADGMSDDRGLLRKWLRILGHTDRQRIGIRKAR